MEPKSQSVEAHDEWALSDEELDRTESAVVRRSGHATWSHHGCHVTRHE